MKSLKKNFRQVLDVLEQILAGDSDDAARCQSSPLVQAMQSSAFLSYLGMWFSILAEINDTQSFLQTNGLNLDHCVLKISSLKSRLEADRDSIVDEALRYSANMCDDLGVVEPERRIRKRKVAFNERSEPTPPMSAREVLRHQMFESVDRISAEIGRRFEDLHAIAKKFSILLPANLLNASFPCNVEMHARDIDPDEFSLERKRIAAFLKALDNADTGDSVPSSPLELLNFIYKSRLESSVPNLVVLLRIFLTLGTSVATSERSFSKLKLIKTHLRSTMGQLRLTNLSIVSIEHEVAEQIDLNFSSKSARSAWLG